MLLKEALDLVEVNVQSWRVHFQRQKANRWIPDFFPGGEEEGLRSEDEAHFLAERFAKRSGRRVREVRIVMDTEPVRLTEGSIVVPYARVSTSKQDEECAAQVDSMTSFIRTRLMGDPVNAQWNGKFYIDYDVTSKMSIFERPAGWEAVKQLRRGDHFVVASTDRAWGSAAQVFRCLENWHKRGIIVHIVSIGLDTDTMIGRFAVGCLALVKQIELELCQSRTRDTMAARRRRRQPTNGNTPYGFMTVGDKGSRRFVPNLDELRIMQKMHHWRTVLGHTYYKISKALRESRITRANGKEWAPGSVHLALKQFKAMLKRNDPILKELATSIQIEDSGLSGEAEMAAANNLQEPVDGTITTAPF